MNSRIALIASSMSCRERLGSRRIDEHLGRFDRSEEVRVLYGLGNNEIDRSAEELFQVFQKAEVGVWIALTENGIELDQKVEVASAGPVVAGGGQIRRVLAVVRSTGDIVRQSLCHLR